MARGTGSPTSAVVSLNFLTLSTSLNPSSLFETLLLILRKLSSSFSCTLISLFSPWGHEDRGGPSSISMSGPSSSSSM